jgi:hypothetical protein
MRNGVESFRGEAPRLTPRALPENGAQVALNARLQSGDLEAWRQFFLNKTLANPGDVKTIYLLNGAWLSWEVDVDVARGTIAGDTTFRVYLTGPELYAQPRFTNFAMATSGAEPFPVLTRPVGVPAPDSQPTLVAGVSTAPTSTTTEVLDNGDQLDTAWTTNPQISGGFTTATVTQDAVIGNGPPSYRLDADENFDNPAYLVRDFGVGDASVIEYSCDFRFNAEAFRRFNANLLCTNTGAGISVRWSEDGSFAVGIASALSDRNISNLEVINIGAPTPGLFYTMQASIVVNPGGTKTVRAAIFLGSAQIGSTITVTNAFVNSGGFLAFVLEIGGDAVATYQTWIDNILVRGTTPTDALTQTATSYVYTFVNDLGEESAPSPASATILKDDGTSITVTTATAVQSGFSTDYGVATKRIYRAVTGNTGTVFRFVAEIPLAQADYVDELTDSELGDVLESDEWDLPPDDLRGILALPNGIMVGFRRNQLCFSVQNHPHAWPVRFRLNTDTDIVAIGNIDTTVVVGTEAFPYTAAGNDPSAFSMTKLEVPQACVSKRSLAYLSAIGIVFASPDGLIAVSGNGRISNLTESVYTRKQWQALRPETILGVAHDDVYHFFSGTAGSAGTAQELFDTFDEESDFLANQQLLVPSTWTWDATGNSLITEINKGATVTDEQLAGEQTASGPPIPVGANFTFTVRLLQDVGTILEFSNSTNVQLAFDVDFNSFIAVTWTPGSDGSTINVQFSDPTGTITGDQSYVFAAGNAAPLSLTVVFVVTPTGMQVTFTASNEAEPLTDSFVADFSWAQEIFFAFMTAQAGNAFRKVFIRSLEVTTAGSEPAPGDEKGHALDMKQTGFGLIELGHHAIAVHAPPLTDQLYLVLDSNDEPVSPYLDDTAGPVVASPAVRIFEFDSPNSNTLLTYQWKGKLNRLPEQVAFIYCQVKAGDYDNVVLNFYGDGVLFFSQTLTGKEPFTLPLSDAYETFEIELLGTSRVESVRVAESIEELEKEG